MTRELSLVLFFVLISRISEADMQVPSRQKNVDGHSKWHSRDIVRTLTKEEERTVFPSNRLWSAGFRFSSCTP